MIARIAPFLIAFVISGVALGYAYYLVDQHGYDRCQKEVQSANLDLAITYANELTKAMEERDANKAIIDNYAARARRVPVHIPVCENANAKDSNGRAGLLSGRVDKSFARLRERVTVLFERCEALNADAIKNNSVTQ